MKKRTCIFHLRSLLIACICSFPLLARAQVTLNVQLPPGGRIQKEQLWNLNLISSQSDILSVVIKLTLQEVVTNQEVLSASSGTVLLSKGIKVLNNGAVQPVLYNYDVAEFSGIFLPIGTYIACYQVYKMQGEDQVPLSNQCITFSVDPLSPPLLSFPNDQARVESPYPSFVWMPPAPLDMFSNLSYDILVTEVAEGQSAAEAIEYNTPTYSNYGLTQPTDNYPSSFNGLDTAKTYAWQVIARNGVSYAGKTEVWTFKVNAPVPVITIPFKEGYILLEQGLKDTYFIPGPLLHIKYNSADKDHLTVLNFYDATGSLVLSIKKNMVQGNNYYDLDIIHQLHRNTPYTVSITDINGRTQQLQFSINQ